MAFINQEKKAIIAAELKKVMPKDWKYTLAVDNHSTLVLTIKSAPFDLVGEFNRVSNQIKNANGFTKAYDQTYCQVNTYWLQYHFEGELLAIMEKIKRAMNAGNWDKSDLMSDYHDVGHYIEINIGRWNKPFVVVTNAKAA